MIKLEIVEDYFWDELEKYEKDLNEYYSLLYSCGIDYDCYNDIQNYSKYLRTRIAYYKSFLLRIEKNNSFNFIKEEIKASVIGLCIKLPDFGKEVKEFQKSEVVSRIEALTNLYNSYEALKRVCDIELSNCTLRHFILANSSLLHLVYTNNNYPKIKKYSSDSYMFLCQFHNEKTPSMGVTSFKNLYLCFGCGSCGNVIDYIRQYENLDYHGALRLLSRIYMIDLDYNDILEDDEVVLKYQKALLSEDFRSLINVGLERVMSRENYTNADQEAMIYFDKLNYMIERIKNKESIRFKKNTEIGKVLKLELPFEDEYEG